MSNLNNNPNDKCNTPKDSELSILHATDKAKKIIDNIFNPLSLADKRSYSNAGYSSNTLIDTYETTYEIINLDPNNPYDIYYRDDNPDLWQKNRNADTNFVRENIQTIHDFIITPIRTRISNMFGDSVKLKVELCFMSKDALISHRLPLDHLFSKAKAVLVILEDVRASMVYDDIIYWINNEEIKENEIKPKYGLMKLCNIESETQRLYFTLPFTETELNEDELLLHNYSNFYYSESNDFKMLPDVSTSTKIFPSFHEDNNVEDVFNKADDLQDDIDKLTKDATEANLNNNTDEYDRLTKEKINKELQLDLLNNPNINMTTYDIDIKLKEKVHEILNNDDTKEELNHALNEKEELFTYQHMSNFDKEYYKLNKLEDKLLIELEINTEDKNYLLYKSYFDYHRLILVNALYSSIKDIPYKISDEDLNNELTYRISIYQAEYKSKYDTLYQQKYDLLEDKDTPIVIEENEIDMSNLIYPTKENVYLELSKEYNQFKDSILDIYHTMSFNKLDTLDLSTYSLTEYFNQLSTIELLDIQIKEISKFPLLIEIKKLLEEKKEYIATKESFHIDTLSDYIKENNNIDNNFLLILNDKSDYELISDYYFETIKTVKSDIDDIDNIVEFSKKLSKIFKDNQFDASIIPLNNTLEYAEFSIKYLSYELEVYKELKNADKINTLTQLIQDYNNDIKVKNYKNINLNKYKSIVFQFNDTEYHASKVKRLKTYYTDSNKDTKERVINYLASKVLEIQTFTKDLYWYTSLNTTGLISINNQLISYQLNKLIENKEIKELKLRLIPEDIISSINLITDKVKEITNHINHYLDIENNYMIHLLYPNKNKYQLDGIINEDNIIHHKINLNLIKLHKIFESYSYYPSLVDYGHEYVSLIEQISELKYNEKITSDNAYLILLKENRLICKRDYGYLCLKDDEKKKRNYEEEAKIALSSGRLGRYEKIKNDIIPEINRLIQLKEDVILDDLNNSEYLNKRNNATMRLKFLYSKHPDDIWLLYRSITNDITTDFLNNEGIFKDTNLNNDDLYKLYLISLIDVLQKYNNRNLDIEILQLQKELEYLNNMHNEKKQFRIDTRLQVEKRLKEIEDEINKREKDKLYLHEVTIKTSIETDMKLDYKGYMVIENLPSKGIIYKFPFQLYDDFKIKYMNTINNSNINFIETLYAYKQYSKNFYMFEYNFDYNCENIHDIWTKINYNLFFDPVLRETYLPKLTSNVNKYKIIIPINEAYTLEEMLGFTLPNLIGFLEYETIPTLSEYSNDNISSIIILSIRRGIDFKDDISLFFKNYYEVKEDIDKLITINTMI